MVVSILICCRTRTPRNLSYKTLYFYLLSIATSGQGPGWHPPVKAKAPNVIEAQPCFEVQGCGERFVPGDSRFKCPATPSHDVQMLGETLSKNLPGYAATMRLRIARIPRQVCPSTLPSIQHI